MSTTTSELQKPTKTRRADLEHAYMYMHTARHNELRKPGIGSRCKCMLHLNFLSRPCLQFELWPLRGPYTQLVHWLEYMHKPIHVGHMIPYDTIWCSLARLHARLGGLELFYIAVAYVIQFYWFGVIIAEIYIGVCMPRTSDYSVQLPRKLNYSLRSKIDDPTLY